MTTAATHPDVGAGDGAPGRVAIVGPGLMGLGIAHVAARAGWEVLLFGRDPEAGRAGRRRLEEALRRQAGRGVVSEADADRIVEKIDAPAHDEAMNDCRLVIESVPEDRPTKAATLRRIEATSSADTVIATNTSGLPVDGLADALSDPGRLVGLHFFSPADRMPLVEVVAGPRTREAVRTAAVGWVESVGQTPVLVRDGPGFFTSRVFAAYLDEAIAMVGEGIDAGAIDEAGRALGRALGPLAVVDAVSLTLNLQQARQALADGWPPRACRPLARPVLEAMVAAGRRGRRDGGGFFDETPDGRRVPWRGLSDLFGRSATPPSLDDIAQRLRWAEALEALRCLCDGVVATADDADAASRLGLGFPDGGVMHWVERTGLPTVRRVADQLAQAHGERFRRPPDPSGRLDTADDLSAWRRRRTLE